MKLAISGAMGCGKSAACGIFAEKGFAVFSADKFCADLLVENVDVKNEVKSLLGNNAFDKNGVADKAYIAEKVFVDAALLKAYEAIFHKRFNAFIDSCNTGLSLFEVPLLFEKNLERNFDLCISIFCSESVRRKRLGLRGMSETEISRRDAFQLSCAKKALLADIVLFNDGSEAFLAEQIDVVIKKLRLK